LPREWHIVAFHSVRRLKKVCAQFVIVGTEQVYECAVALSHEIEPEDVVDGHLEETRRARKTTCRAAKAPAHSCRYLLRVR
jgi:hypothetical protein